MQMKKRRAVPAHMGVTITIIIQRRESEGSLGIGTSPSGLLVLVAGGGLDKLNAPLEYLLDLDRSC